MVKKQERLYIPAYDPDYDIYCAKEGFEKREMPISESMLNRRFNSLIAISEWEKVTPEKIREFLSTKSSASHFSEHKGWPLIPLENDRLILKRPSLDNYLAAARTIEEFEPQINDWLYEESHKNWGHRKRGYESYVSDRVSFREMMKIPPILFFKFDYRTLAFPESGDVVTGLAKIGKAASYESRYVRKTVNYPPGTDLFNELLVDWSDYPAADGFGSIKGNSPIYTLILTAQSGQDLDVLEVKLGLDGGLEND